MLIRRAKYRVASVTRRRGAAARSPRKLFHLEHATWVTRVTLSLRADHTSLHLLTTWQGRNLFVAYKLWINLRVSGVRELIGSNTIL